MRITGIWIIATVFLLGSLGWANVVAQGTPTPTSADYEATIEALETQVAQLQERVKALSEQRTAGSSSAAQAGETPESEAATYNVGDTVSVNDWSFAVTDVELAPTVDLSNEQFVARGIFVVVYLSITNSGNAPQSFPYDEFLVEDSAGRSYGLHTDSTIPFQIYVYDTSLYGDLQPGLPYESVAVFEIPADATGLTLKTEDPSPFRVNLGV
jgi:hypothetical protein